MASITVRHVPSGSLHAQRHKILATCSSGARKYKESVIKKAEN
jgi:hypothetical protein